MKNWLVVVAALLSLASCTGKKSPDRLHEERDSLALLVTEKDSIIDDVFSSINLIAENLNAIKTRERIVTTNTNGEISKEQRAQINEDIAAIGELLEQNRATIERLKGSTERLRQANVRIQELERLVDNLTRQIREKDADIETLKGELDRLHIRVTELTATVDTLHSGMAGLSEENRTLESTVAEQGDRLNTVYYIVGSDRELIRDGIVVKSGGIGRTMVLSNNYDLSKLTRVNKENVTRIAVGEKRVTIVTPHPAGSYELIMSDRNTVDELVIKDPEKFWETSRVLVIAYR